MEIVWDKEGNPHRMSVANARDMVNNVGWTRVPPVVAEAAKATDDAFEAARLAAEKEAEAAALEEAKKAAQERAEKVAEAAKAADEASAKATDEAAAKAAEAVTANDPDKLEVEKLKELATSLGVKVDARWSKARLLTEIKKSSQEG